MRKYPFSGALAAAAACALSLAGCGDEPSSTVDDTRAALASVRPCELLTPDEIEAATGRAAGEPQDMSAQAAGVPMCNWPPVGGRSYDVLTGLLVSGNAYDDYEEFLESVRDSPLGAVVAPDEVEEVSGVGDFGVWMSELGMLQVYDGDWMVQINVAAAPGRDEIQAARELAAAALGKLD